MTGQYAIAASSPDKTMHENGLLTVEEHRTQMIHINAAYEKHYLPGCLVYRNAHHDEITADAPSNPQNDDRIGRIVGYAARPALITTNSGVELRFNPLLVRWGGEIYRFRQPYSYSISEVMLYVPYGANNLPPASDAAVGASGQTG